MKSKILVTLLILNTVCEARRYPIVRKRLGKKSSRIVTPYGQHVKLAVPENLANAPVLRQLDPAAERLLPAFGGPQTQKTHAIHPRDLSSKLKNIAGIGNGSALKYENVDAKTIYLKDESSLNSSHLSSDNATFQASNNQETQKPKSRPVRDASSQINISYPLTDIIEELEHPKFVEERRRDAPISVYPNYDPGNYGTVDEHPTHSTTSGSTSKPTTPVKVTKKTFFVPHLPENKLARNPATKDTPDGIGVGTLLSSLALWNTRAGRQYYDNGKLTNPIHEDLVNCTLSINNSNRTVTGRMPCSVAVSVMRAMTMNADSNNAREEVECTIIGVSTTHNEYMTTVPCSMLVQVTKEHEKNLFKGF